MQRPTGRSRLHTHAHAHAAGHPRLRPSCRYDTLSSQTNIAGYRAVVEASHAFGRFFAGQMTAAGKVPPAKVLVLGCGVAGLAAVQTAKNLGAVVSAYDVRPASCAQVESGPSATRP